MTCIALIWATCIKIQSVYLLGAHRSAAIQHRHGTYLYSCYARGIVYRTFPTRTCTTRLAKPPGAIFCVNVNIFRTALRFKKTQCIGRKLFHLYAAAAAVRACARCSGGSSGNSCTCSHQNIISQLLRAAAPRRDTLLLLISWLYASERRGADFFPFWPYTYIMTYVS